MPHYFDTQPAAPHKEREVHISLLGRELIFTTDSGVFSRDGLDYGSRLLIESLPPIDARALDLGCGWGPVGAFWANACPGAQFVLCDVNPRAAALAQKNLEQNRIPNAQVFCGDGFEALAGMSFECIALNPPVRAGKEVVHRLFEEAFLALDDGGALYIVLQIKQGAPSAKKKLETLFGKGQVETVARSAGYHVIRAAKEGLATHR